jgi:hypothetical protein
VANKPKPPAPKVADPSEDLIPRSMLPESSVIPEWRQFGYGAETVKKPAPKTAPKKPKGMRMGGMAYSKGGSIFRKGADGIASKGKTRCKMV